MTIFSVGVSGLNAAQTGILTTGHNIANASTAGYNRQEIVQSTNVPLFTGSGYQGQGTNVSTIRRIYDQFLDRQVLSAEAGASESDSYLAQIQQIDNLLADPSSGLSPAMAEFFKGVQDVAANPSSIPSRQSMLATGQSLVARFQSLDQRLTEIRDGTNAQIQSRVTEINTYSTKIAEVNQRIIMAEASSQGQAPNDLLDQRDQLLQDLNQVIRVSTLTQSDGSFNVFIGNGQPLVVGIDSFELRAVGATDDPERTVVAMVGVGGTQLTLPDSQITGGSLGGLVGFRNLSLDAAQNALGRIAITVAQNFNDQHKLGLDLTGAFGLDLFKMAQPTVFASSQPALPTGTITVSYDTPHIDRLTSSDYRLAYNTVAPGPGGPYILTRLDTGTTQSFGALPQTLDGITIDANTWLAPVSGDSFLIQPTRLGARNIAMAITDARAIAAAAPIRTSALLANTGTASISAGTVNEVIPPAVLDPNLQNKITIDFTTATTFTVTDAINGVLAAGLPYVSGGDITYNGWTMQITGNPATGDVFTVGANSAGVADNRNAMLLGALQTSRTMLGSATTSETASYQAAYSQIVSSIGSKANEVQAVGEAQQGLVESANKAVQQMSGVNLDEEAANLLRYQQAYQASAKILATASKIFEEILALGR